ncbi:transformer 2 beta, partial [Coemansia sp. 'formosensis']
RDDKAQGRFAGHRDEDRDTKRYRVDEQAAVAEEGGQSSYYTHGRPIRDEQKNGMQPSSVLGIFGMSKFTNEEALREMFGDFGPVTKVQIIRDQNMGHSRGYAFINMANVADAQKAREALNDTMVHDRRVRVDFSFTSRPHSPTPGKYRGQDTAARRQEYRPRRRANSRDRRRDQERHYAPSRGAWGRSSRSPGHRRPSPARRRAASPGGEYQPPPMSHGAPPPMLASRSSYMSYRSSHTDHGRSEYGGHSRSRSPHRRPAHPQHPDYHHGRSDSRNRYSRNEHRHDAYDRHY